MDLKELLGEDLYKQVMQKLGDHKIDIVSNGQWFPKEKFNAVNEDNKNLKKQLKERDGQLEELKKIDPEGLKQKIEELQQTNEQTKNDYEKKLADQAFNFALKGALADAKVKNPKTVEALLNKDAIKLDGDKLLGLEEQLKAIKESDAYLFESEKQQQQTPPKWSTGTHQNPSNDGEPTSLHEALAQRFSQN